MRSGDTSVMVGASRATRILVVALDSIAQRDVSVLVIGETGVGKELVAREIHRRSRRASRTLVPVNCAALPDGLVETELFGHERGAFTGAGQERKGLFQMADGGTLFLDEVGDLSLTAQAKLLRVLETGRFFRVGGETLRQSDVRVIAATNRDLEAMVVRGEFRADLFYRLAEEEVRVSPLRERPEDIPPLLDHFLRTLSAGQHPGLTAIGPEVMAALRAYDWPGNVRELRNCALRLSRPGYGGMATTEDLPPRVRGAGTTCVLLRALERLVAQAPIESLRMDAVSWLERHLILNALEKTQGRKKTAARLLGVSLNTVKAKIRKYEIPTEVGLVTERVAEPSVADQGEPAAVAPRPGDGAAVAHDAAAPVGLSAVRAVGAR